MNNQYTISNGNSEFGNPEFLIKRPIAFDVPFDKVAAIGPTNVKTMVIREFDKATHDHCFGCTQRQFRVHDDFLKNNLRYESYCSAKVCKPAMWSKDGPMHYEIEQERLRQEKELALVESQKREYEEVLRRINAQREEEELLNFIQEETAVPPDSPSVPGAGAW